MNSNFTLRALNSLIPLFFLILPLHIHAQTELSRILYSGESFEQITQSAEDYFQSKHPSLELRQLAEGEYRDGEFVKYMRWKHFWQYKLNSDGTLGDPTAYALSKNNLGRSTSSYSEVEWRNIGLPLNLGGQIGVGRTTAVDFHPTDVNTFWVATAMGGIWKTVDGGQSYIPIGDNLPTLAVVDVLVDKSNPQIIYAATGDRVYYGLFGIGVMKSIDGGATWETTALQWPFSDYDRIYAMEADPTDPQTIFVASDKGLFKTTDGFTTVNQILTSKAYDVRFNPGDANIVYATAGNAFWKSTNGGSTFNSVKTVSQPSILRITVTPAAPNRVYFSNRNDLYQSFDSGSTFPTTRDISSLNNGSLGYCILSAQDPDVIYGGYFNTWKSTDNGVSWSRITCFSGDDEIHVDNHFAAINPLNPSDIYFCNDGGIYAFEENPCRDCNSCYPVFRDLSSGMMISQYYDISNSQQSINLISGGTQDNGSFFRNKSLQWQFYAPTGDGMVGAIDPTDDNYQYWTYQFGSMYRYSNGGNTCISCNIPNGEHGEGAWVTPYQLDPNNPSTIIAGYSRVYRSLNRGNSWTAISPQLAGGQDLHHIAIAPSNSAVVYAVHNSSSRLFRTTQADGNNPNWTTFSLPSGGVSSLAVDPQNENRIYVSKGGFTEGEKIFRSDNGGQSWTNISGSLPNVPANVIKVLQDPVYEGALFVGTDAGVYYRPNQATDWEEYGALSHTYVRDIEFQYTSKQIRIGTHGRAIYEAFLPDNPCAGDNPPDADQDGVCDALDICPGGDDRLDDDGDGIPNDCEVYCEAIGSPGTGSDYITSVKLNTLSNTSGKTPYSDFTDMSTNLEAGKSYTLEIGLSYSFPLDAAYGWIDFNQNKEFEDSELINMSGFDGNHKSQGTFIVPDEALPGPTVLRVRCIYRSPQIADPCGSYFGEVEDYTTEIINLTTDFSADETNPCTGIDVKFSHTTLGLGSGTPTFSWSFPGGTPSSSTEENPTVSYAHAGTYNVSLIVSQDGLATSKTKLNYIQVTSCGPDWPVTQTGDNHTILIQQNDFSVSLASGQSLEVGDYIGAFYLNENEELICGGKAPWSNENFAIRVFGDDLTTEEAKEGFSREEAFQWKIWNASDNEEIDMLATYAEPQNVITHKGEFEINGVSQLTQLKDASLLDNHTLTLMPGWNLISSYVQPRESDMEAVFSPISDQLIIVKDGDGSAYIPSLSDNAIGHWEVEKGYQAKLLGSDPIDLEISGTQADLGNTPIALSRGWNLIAYLRENAQAIETAMASIADEIHLVKDVDGYIYMPSLGINNIGDMEAGQGYWVKMNSELTLNYQARLGTPPVNMHTSLLSSIHYKINRRGSQNATMILDTKGLINHGDEVGVFDKAGNLAGAITYEDHILAFSIWGDDPTTEVVDGIKEGEEFEIRVWNKANEMEETYTFQAHAHTYTTHGVIEAELLRSTNTSPHLEVNSLILYPNPTQGNATLSMELRSSAHIEITVFDIAGKHLLDVAQKKIASGKYEWEIQTDGLANGLYHCKVIVEGVVHSIPFSVGR